MGICLTGIIDVKRDFGAVGDGVANDTPNIQAALNAAGPYGKIRFPPANYLNTSTLYGYTGQNFLGVGQNGSVISRLTDYGDTLVIGNATMGQHAGAAVVEGLRFWHGPDFINGSTSLVNKATSGSHIKLVQGQQAIIKDVWLDRLPYGIHLDGGAVVTLERVTSQGVYDPLNIAAQEGIADIFIDAANTNPTLITIIEPYLAAEGRSASRTYTYSCIDGNVIKTGTQAIGRKWGIFNTGCEDFKLIGGFIGGNSQQGYFSCPRAGTTNLEQKIIGTSFDSAGGPGCADIYFDSQDANTCVENVTISGITGNGEDYGQYAIFEANGLDLTKPAVRAFNITGNTFDHYVGTPIFSYAAQRGLISNVYNEYNSLGIGHTDSAYVNAVYLGAHASGILCNGTVAYAAHGVRAIESASASCFARNTLFNGTLT